MTQAAPAVDLPEKVPVATPTTEEDLALLLKETSADGGRAAVWGGGTHRDIGHHVDPTLVISTAGFTGIREWEADDLTVVVGAGTPVSELEAELQAGGQTAILPEDPGLATVGGVVATSTSAYARLRYGPTRDRVLEVQAVTGDGRSVKGGGRVVKNVTGYDLPRLYSGSFGSLGVITTVCLKLWPLTEATRTVVLDELPSPDDVYRPRAVLQTPENVTVLLSGTADEVEEQARRLGGDVGEGLRYPGPVSGDLVWSLRIRPSRLVEALRRLPPHASFVAQHGVGEVTFGTAATVPVDEIRRWAESEGGTVVRLQGRSGVDPWGTPPPALEVQRRIIAAFDPARILEPGRLPGRL